MGDPINHPDHYRLAGGVECIDIISAVTAGEGEKGFLVGNVLKYMIRAPKKGGLEDHKKAYWYLGRLISIEEVESDASE